MHVRTLAASVLVSAFATFANAETWTSPDGFLSITPPEASTFQAIPTPPPPIVGLWMSNDKSMRFAVLTTQIPPNIKLIQSSAEQGLAEEIGGKVTRLPTRKVSGYEVWSMKGTGSSVSITQALVRHDGTLYKVMAATVGPTADNELAERFVNSLSIAERSNAVPSKLSADRPLKDLGGGVDFHNLSKAIGGGSALLGIVLLIYFAVSGKKSRQS